MEERLLVRQDTIIYKGEKYTLNDLFTEEFYQYSNRNAKKFESNIYIVNEIFLGRIQPALALMLFLEMHKISYIKIEGRYSLLVALIIDIAKRCKIKIEGARIANIPLLISSHITILASVGFLLFRMIVIPHTLKNESIEDNFSIIRTQAARNKLAFLKDITIRFEQPTGKETIYNCYTRAKRLSWVFKAWIGAYGELHKYRKDLRKFIGNYSALDTFAYYSKRVVHTLLYSHLLDNYFSIHEGGTFYTGNNLDRFSIIEEQLAKKYNIKTVCIPHGLEYGFKLPHCFTCDEFYTTSSQAARHLNTLYKTAKFKYDAKIAQQMFEVHSEQKGERSIVFFTEPREVYVNVKIIDELLPLMRKEHLQLSIKLHPKDKKTDYVQYEGRVNFIDNLNDAISHNICFSRKSTTLLEAVYNNSVSAAILTNAKDIVIFNTFPSLQDEKIKTFYSVQDLFSWINFEWQLTQNNKNLLISNIE